MKSSKKVLGFELKRQAFHLVFGSVIAFMIIYLGRDTSLAIVGVAIMIGALTSNVAKKFKIPVVSIFLDTFERKGVTYPGYGAMSALGGALIALAFFDAFAVFISMLLLAYVDSFSTVVGMAFGRTKLLGKKTLEGFVGGFLAGVFVTSLFLPLQTAILASFVAAVVEILPADDNITIPPMVSLVLTYLKL